MILKTIVLLSFMFSLVMRAHASDAKDLIVACKISDQVRPDVGLKSEDYGKAMWCQGMVEGVLRTLLILQGERDESGVRKTKDSVCIPYGLSLGNHIAAVLKFAKEHPEDVEGDAPSFIVQAVLTAYPCKI